MTDYFCDFPRGIYKYDDIFKTLLQDLCGKNTNKVFLFNI